MDFLQLIIKQIEDYLNRELTEPEKKQAEQLLRDDAKVIELYIIRTAKKYTEALYDSGH